MPEDSQIWIMFTQHQIALNRTEGFIFELWSSICTIYALAAAWLHSSERGCSTWERILLNLVITWLLISEMKLLIFFSVSVSSYIFHPHVLCSGRGIHISNQDINHLLINQPNTSFPPSTIFNISLLGIVVILPTIQIALRKYEMFLCGKVNTSYSYSLNFLYIQY